ncbi:MAG: hypothetical protein LBR44_09920 [Clostridiales Family XIII bacterium]|jgi:hypothetical protein|nr:hypothetical protein [Clostridiales Family XIII bacterium]
MRLRNSNFDLCASYRAALRTAVAVLLALFVAMSYVVPAGAAWAEEAPQAEPAPDVQAADGSMPGGLSANIESSSISVDSPAVPTIIADPESLDFGAATVGELAELGSGYTTFFWEEKDAAIGDIRGLQGSDLVSVTGDFEIKNASLEVDGEDVSLRVDVVPVLTLGPGTHNGELTLTLPSAYGNGGKWTKSVSLSVTGSIKMCPGTTSMEHFPPTLRVSTRK